MDCLQYTQTPCVTWKDDLPVQIIVKMECSNHPFVSGNKWWKLKYNLQAAIASGLPILTFGGAYSNHIFAVAAATKELGLNSIGIIRGEPVTNSTLAFARECGMKLSFVSREEYREKSTAKFVDGLRRSHGDFFLLPEGGTNAAAIKGCSEWGEQLRDEIDFDTLCLAVGTGGTMAGLISAIGPDKKTIGFSSLKGGDFLEEEIRKLLKVDSCDWRVNTSYHFGGYARTNSLLSGFIEEVRSKSGIVLDPVYTSKLMYGVLDLARNGEFEEGSTVLVLHTGGLQGQSCFDLRQTSSQTLL